MNSKLFFFITSTTIFILGLISICCAPIINRIANADFENWKSLNCQYYSDLDSLDNKDLNMKETYTYLKNLCYRQKAMYNLEYSSLIIDSILSFICLYLSLLLLLDVGKSLQNKIGLIGLCSGIISFIITLVYVCYSGYIFNNDKAYGKIDFTNDKLLNTEDKLFSNGAKYKWSNNKYITIYEEDTGEYSQFIKYNELNGKQYNYDKELSKKYEKYNNSDPCYGAIENINTKINNCDYIFRKPIDEVKNKYLYDRWMTTLVLSCFIFIFNLVLSFFGFLLFREKVEINEINNSSPDILQINTKNANNNNDVVINQGNDSGSNPN